MMAATLTAIQLAMLPALVLQDFSTRDIAVSFGVSTSAIVARCRQLGIETPAERKRRLHPDSLHPANRPGRKGEGLLPPDWTDRDTAVIPPPVALPPDREPCTYCAQRGDRPCRHRPWIAAPPPPAPEPPLTLAQRIHAEAQAIVTRRALARVQGINADFTPGGEL